MSHFVAAIAGRMIAVERLDIEHCADAVPKQRIEHLDHLAMERALRHAIPAPWSHEITSLV